MSDSPTLTLCQQAIREFNRLLTDYGVGEAFEKCLNHDGGKFRPCELQLRKFLAYYEKSRPNESESEQFLEEIRNLGEPPMPGVDPVQVGTTIQERFQLVREIGKGRFSDVWQALDKKLSRHVAIKFIRSGQTGLAEALILTRLEDERHIVNVYEVGQYSDISYVVMQLCEQGTLVDILNSSETLAVGNVVEIVRQIATGLSSAHALGIVHRDLKPQNILCAGGGIYKIADFGVSHLCTDDIAAHEIRGTRQFMSPEVQSGKPADIRSDIFSLGLIFYELLTRHAPCNHEKCDADSSYARSGRTWPLPCSIDPELCLIVEKCLFENPDCRYASAAELVIDLVHWMHAEPTTVGCGRSLRRTLRWCGVHPKLTKFAVAACAVSFIIAIFVAISHYSQSTRIYQLEDKVQRNGIATSRDQQRDQEEAVHQLFSRAMNAKKQGRPTEALAFLSAAKRRLTDQSDLQGAVSFVFSDLRKEVGQALVHNRQILCADLSNDGRLIATGGRDNKALVWGLYEDVVKLHHTPLIHSDDVTAVAFSPDNNTVFTATSTGSITSWDIRNDVISSILVQQGPLIYTLSVSPDGAILLSAGDSDTVSLWDCRTTREIAKLDIPNGAVWDADFSDDNQFFAICGEGNFAMVFRRDTLECVATVIHKAPVSAVAFTPDSRFLATSSYDHTLRLSDVSTGKQFGQTMVHPDRVTSVTLSRDGHFILTGTERSGVHCWRTKDQTRVVLDSQWLGWSVVTNVSADFQHVLMIDRDCAHWISVRCRQPVFVTPCPPNLSASSQDANSSICPISCDDTTYVLFNEGGEVTPRLITHAGVPQSVAASPDGRICGIVDRQGQVYVQDVKTTVITPGVGAADVTWKMITFLSNLKFVTAADKSIGVWDTKSATQVESPIVLDEPIAKLAVSPTSDLLAIVSGDRTLSIWSTKSWQMLGPSISHSAPITAVRFGCDGKLIATCCQNSDTTIRPTTIGDGDLITITTPSEGRCVTLSPDSKQVAIGCVDGRVYIYNLAPFAEMDSMSFGESALFTVSWNADRRMLFAMDSLGQLFEHRFEPPFEVPSRLYELWGRFSTGLCLADDTFTASVGLDEWLRCRNILYGGQQKHGSAKRN